MKTILTFVGGGERDPIILQTALAAAAPLSAHLECLHARVPASQAARHANLGFASGDALTSAFDRLGTDADTFSRLAEENVRAFCAKAGIEMRDEPTDAEGVTARFVTEESNELERLSAHASRRDLVVIGRARQKQGLAPDTLEHLVRTCGRPVLAAATEAPQTLTGTIMVCWKDPGSAALVTSAAPLLAKAGRVVFVSVARRDDGREASMRAAARDVAGGEAEVQIVAADGRGVLEALTAAAEECGADLLIAGAYGRSRGRQILFGSRSDKLLAELDRPMLLCH